MLTTDQRDGFRTTGLLRLAEAFSPATAEAMCDRLWEFLASRDAIHRDEPSTWTVEHPAGFQPVTHSGAFRAVGGGPLRAALAAHPWLRGLWKPGESGDRMQRYMNDGTVIDGVPLRVVELTGEPGDVILMHSDCFHAAALNRLTGPRMMLTGMVVPNRSQQ